MGGELSYYNHRDQKFALSDEGPNGIRFADSAKQFHISYMIADGQPAYQSIERIKEASMALGYRFRVTKFQSGNGTSQVTIRNEGIAPLYHDAFVTVNGVRTTSSLKGLLPGEERIYPVEAGSLAPKLTIESDRLVQGQGIQFDADLEGMRAIGDSRVLVGCGNFPFAAPQRNVSKRIAFPYH